MATSGSDADAPVSEPPAPGRAGVLLPVAWCVWMLLSLAPTMLMAPHVRAPWPWLARGAAPGAVLAAGAFFLAVVWPFWPAMAGPWRKKGTGSFSCLSEKAPVPFLRRASAVVRWFGAGVLEFGVLVALAVPFGLVARSVGEGNLAVWPAAASAAGLGVLGLGLRTAAAGMAPAAGRWLVFAALLVCVGPLVLAYAAAETMGVSLPRLLEVSPLFGLVGVGMDGWPAESSWPWVARLWLWPGVGVALMVVGLFESRHRSRGDG